MPGARIRVKPSTAEEPSASDKASQLEIYLQKQFEEDIASDAYTECDIKHQENEIIAYLEKQLKLNKQAISSSPSTDLTKEYYSLVSIEGNILEKELIEQDVLLNAFQSIRKLETENKNKVSIHSKPTSLSLTSSHRTQALEHSDNCDILMKCNPNSEVVTNIDNNKKGNNSFTDRTNSLESPYKKEILRSSYESLVDKVDATYSPDSLITDDPTSSSDYLSAANTCSPGISSPQLNVENTINMESVFTSSDSGMENTGLLESQSSHKDVTLPDMSLTESTLQDLTGDNVNSRDSIAGEYSSFQRCLLHSTANDACSENNLAKNNKSKDSCKTSKEEKQRQNQEIVVLESSSLSSETGSWESVFPPKAIEREICEKFIHNERSHFNEESMGSDRRDSGAYVDDLCPSLVQKSPFKSTSCFIDAASLVDEEDDIINIQTDANESGIEIKTDIPGPSQPLPCSTVKVDMSPNDWSESNENEDSLEQQNNKDPDSIQKDLSPTIFEMTPITEDSLCAFEPNKVDVQESVKVEVTTTSETTISQERLVSSSVFVSTTPHNSIMSVNTATSEGTCASKQFGSDSESDGSYFTGTSNSVKAKRYDECLPIVSGGASIEDHLPQVTNFSPLTRRKIENIPIVSGAYVPTVEDNKVRKSPRPVCASAWIVDMSKSDDDKSLNSVTKRPSDKTCESLKNESSEICKSRSSVDSDGSDKSSQKFFIDLSSLPVSSTPEKKDAEVFTEKKNIFSMYIDLGDKSTTKMPTRLSSSLNSRKSSSSEPKTPKSVNSSVNKPPSDVILDSTFEAFETLCNDPSVSITEIIRISKDRPKLNDLKKDKSNSEIQKKVNTVIHEESVEAGSTELYVKLSDLDKPMFSTDNLIPEEKVLDVRMTRSIPENNWGESHHAPRSMDVISSFHSENALSLNRLFPHLKAEFSRSMPGCLSNRARSPMRFATSNFADVDEHSSDMSDISSVQSSACRSVIENSTSDDTSHMSNAILKNCQSRLGQDLLRMFLEEIAPDVVVEVSGRRIKAHKCILSSRCQYFAGILSGGWVESAGNVIPLPPFSINVVHFALCHIYSGVSNIPDTISIVELATIADMLGLEGLKEAIMFTLKEKYCHHFHKPCPVCVAGVLECFPLSSVYGLDDLYRKCLKWITKYFSKVWPTKAFATLPIELLDKCYHEHSINLSSENLVSTIYGCVNIMSTPCITQHRWASSVVRMCSRMMAEVAQVAARRLVAALRGLRAEPATPPPRAALALHDTIALAIRKAPPDEACRAYAFLSDLLKHKHSHSKPDLLSENKPDNFLTAHASGWRSQIEGALVRDAGEAVHTQAFKELPPDLRKRLAELGCINCCTFREIRKPPKQSPILSSGRLDIDRVRAAFVPYRTMPEQVTYASSQKYNILEPKVGLRSNIESKADVRVDPRAKSNPPKIRTTKAQEERAKFNLTKKNQSQERVSNRSSMARVHSLDNTKPRYLEPRPTNPTTKKLAPKKISSSESSRNSSPNMLRNMRTMKSRHPSDSKAQTMSQDSLATSSRPRTAEPSTDSLTESQNSNKYATYTKIKHPNKFLENKSSKPQLVQGANKTKTKIPVYKNQVKTRNDVNNAVAFKRVSRNGKSSATTGSTNSVGAANTARPTDSTAQQHVARKFPGSLMTPTKSSSAKMVTKIVKENVSKTKHNKKQTTQPTAEEQQMNMLGRSGTFVKEEPSYVDETTDIDRN